MSMRYSLWAIWKSDVGYGLRNMCLGIGTMLMGLWDASFGALHAVFVAWRVNKKRAGDDKFWAASKSAHADGIVVETENKQ